MIYVYKNSAGETREIVASMKNPPPEHVQFAPDGTWKEALTFQGVPVPFCDHMTSAFDAPRFLFRRDYSNGGRTEICIKQDGSIKHPHQKGKLPISHLLPGIHEGKVVNRHGHNVREVEKGLYATMKGRPIVDSTSAADRHAARAGYIRDLD